MNDQKFTYVTVARGSDQEPENIPVVIDDRDGAVVYVRPARADEEPGVQLVQDETWVFRVEVHFVFIEGKPNPIRVVPDGRDGSIVYIRELREGEDYTGGVAKFIPRREQLVMTTHITHTAIHTTSEVGRTDDLLTAIRVVPAGRDGSTVFMRTLRAGEPDNGETVRLLPGDSPQFRPHDLAVDLDYIDKHGSVSSDDGYAPITNVLWTWLAMFGSTITPNAARFLLATSRRLDTAHGLLTSVRDDLRIIESDNLSAVMRRDLLYKVIGNVELTVVALHRALRMASDLQGHFSLVNTVPTSVAAKLPDVTKLRDAYEHIDERSLGTRRRKPDPDALSVFDYTLLFSKHVVRYGTHALDLDGDAIQLLLTARDYLKSVTAELTSQKTRMDGGEC